MAPLDKNEMRAAAKAARAALTPERRVEAVEHATQQLLAIPELHTARCVLVYAPLSDELDSLQWIAHWAEACGGAPMPQLAWPRVADSKRAHLTLHICEESELALGSFGLREPRADAPQVTLADVDIVLVPGLAFDRSGYRVGYGGGYYDRLLADAPTTLLTLGLCFREVFFPKIIHDAHDIPVTRVLVA